MRYLVLAVICATLIGCKSEEELAMERASMKEAALAKEKSVAAERESWEKEQAKHKAEGETRKERGRQEVEAEARRKIEIENEIAKIRADGDKEKARMAIVANAEINPLRMEYILRVKNPPPMYYLHQLWVTNTQFLLQWRENPTFARNLARVNQLWTEIQIKEVELKSAMDNKEAEIKVAIDRLKAQL